MQAVPPLLALLNQNRQGSNDQAVLPYSASKQYESLIPPACNMPFSTQIAKRYKSSAVFI
jgi:hypothetical protein